MTVTNQSTPAPACEVFADLYANIVNGEGRRLYGLLPAANRNQWYCGHGLIALLPGKDGKPMPFHNVDPKLVGNTFETTTVADKT